MATKEKVHKMKNNLKMVKQYKYNLIGDSKLLFLAAKSWFDIEFAMHTSVSNEILSQTDTNSVGKDEDINRSKLDEIKHKNYKGLERNNADAYLFDRQYHDCEPHTYLDHVWCTVYDAYDNTYTKSNITTLNTGFVECYETDCKCERSISQSSCHIKDNKLFIDGGITANTKNCQTLSDLYFSDLKDHKWYKLNYNNVVEYLMVHQMRVVVLDIGNKSKERDCLIVSFVTCCVSYCILSLRNCLL